MDIQGDNGDSGGPGGGRMVILTFPGGTGSSGGSGASSPVAGTAEYQVRNFSMLAKHSIYSWDKESPFL